MLTHTAVLVASEVAAEASEAHETNSWYYGATALAVLLFALFCVTRLNLDR